VGSVETLDTPTANNTTAITIYSNGHTSGYGSNIGNNDSLRRTRFSSDDRGGSATAGQLTGEGNSSGRNQPASTPIIDSNNSNEWAHQDYYQSQLRQTGLASTSFATSSAAAAAAASIRKRTFDPEDEHGYGYSTRDSTTGLHSGASVPVPGNNILRSALQGARTKLVVRTGTSTVTAGDAGGPLMKALAIARGQGRDDSTFIDGNGKRDATEGRDRDRDRDRRAVQWAEEREGNDSVGGRDKSEDFGSSSPLQQSSVASLRTSGRPLLKRRKVREMYLPIIYHWAFKGFIELIYFESTIQA
jgi:hypothetical protein